MQRKNLVMYEKRAKNAVRDLIRFPSHIYLIRRKAMGRTQKKKEEDRPVGLSSMEIPPLSRDLYSAFMKSNWME